MYSTDNRYSIYWYPKDVTNNVSQVLYFGELPSILVMLAAPSNEDQSLKWGTETHHVHLNCESGPLFE